MDTDQKKLRWLTADQASELALELRPSITGAKLSRTIRRQRILSGSVEIPYKLLFSARGIDLLRKYIADFRADPNKGRWSERRVFVYLLPDVSSAFRAVRGSGASQVQNLHPSQEASKSAHSADGSQEA